eukprot:m.32981 g.32981  ORF g.32981 m.32981 type:complete len:1171 (-) comp16735_c0_seq1:76-3588(-)
MDFVELWAQYGPTLAVALIVFFVVQEWLAQRNAPQHVQRAPNVATAYVAPRRREILRNAPDMADFGGVGDVIPPRNEPVQDPAAPPRQERERQQPRPRPARGQPRQPGVVAPPIGRAPSCVSFEEVELDPSLKLKTNGVERTAAWLQAQRAATVAFTYGDHAIIFNITGSMVTARINGINFEEVKAPIHLNLSKHAVCMGDKCVPWPKKKKAEASVSSVVKTKSGAVLSMTPKGKQNQASSVASSSTTAAVVQTKGKGKAKVSPIKIKAKAKGKTTTTATASASVPTIEGDQGSGFANSPMFLEAMVTTNHVINPDGDVVTATCLRRKVIGLYFSAHWCPPCRQFTPKLCKWLQQFQTTHKAKDKLELVFVSKDKTKDDFEEYHATMNFFAIPFAQKETREALFKKFEISSIPALVIVDYAGEVISWNGMDIVNEDVEAKEFPWSNKELRDLLGLKKEIAAPVNETIRIPRFGLTSAGSGTLDLPCVYPYKSVDAVLNWRSRCDDNCIATVPRRQRLARNGSKLMICHDMMGGYNQDKCPQGSDDPHIYRIYDWHKIDSFVYFSHNLVSIPTPAWTNAAHANGVKVFGTFITEWEAGEKVCDAIFANEASVLAFVAALVDIAKRYGFDGYLINIENPLKPAQVGLLKIFLRALTREIHIQIEGSEISWYDAVTIDGELKHQNGVNSKNKPFFDLVDSIFLNYFWVPQQLVRSQLNVGAAKEKEVYAGIDVFGRGTYGGGGFNCKQALEAIQQAGLSTALFAPGWVFEDEQFKPSEFDANSDKFWAQFDGLGLENYPICGVPLVTSFSSGTGVSMSVDGQVCNNKAWSNLSAQSPQLSFGFEEKRNPFFPVPKQVPTDEDTFKMKPCVRDYGNAFQAGNSISISGNVLASAHAVRRGERAVYRLNACDIALKNPLCFSYTFKVSDESYPVDVSVSLLCESSSSPLRYIQLGVDNDSAAKEIDPELSETLFQKFKLRPSDVISKTKDSLVLAESTDAHRFREVSFAREDKSSSDGEWVTRVYILCNKDFKSLTVKEIRLNLSLSSERTERMPLKLHMGEFRFVRVLATSKCDYVLTNLRFSRARWSKINDKTWALSGSLTWDIPSTEFDRCSHYDVWTEGGVLVGRSFGCSFVITKLAVSSESKSLVLKVQPVSVSWMKPSLDACAAITLSF